MNQQPGIFKRLTERPMIIN